MNIITKAKTAALCGISASRKLSMALAFAMVAILSGGAAFAQATPTTTLTTGITEIITEGTVVGIAALGIFVAFVTIMVIKKFFFAGK